LFGLAALAQQDLNNGPCNFDQGLQHIKEFHRLEYEWYEREPTKTLAVLLDWIVGAAPTLLSNKASESLNAHAANSSFEFWRRSLSTSDLHSVRRFEVLS
jgi:hypothetical protein